MAQPVAISGLSARPVPKANAPRVLSTNAGTSANE